MNRLQPRLIIASILVLVLVVSVVIAVAVTKGRSTTSEQTGPQEGEQTEAAHVYNLAWVHPPQAVELQVGEAVEIENEVSMQIYAPSGESAEGVTLIDVCGAAPGIYWYLADADGTPVRDIGPKAPIPEDLRSGRANVAQMSVTAQEGDPKEGYIVAVIDLPGVMALAGETPDDALVAEVVAAGRTLNLKPQSACSPEKSTEIREIPGQATPLSGLADNVLKIPYTIHEEVAWTPEPEPDPEPAPTPVRNPDPVPDPDPVPAPTPEPEPEPAPTPVDVFHECRVASLSAVRSPVLPGWIQYRVGLNYQTNAETSPGIFAQYRVWARTGPKSSPPDGIWQPVTIPARAESWVLEGAFDEMPDGYWEVVAEVSCSGDGDPTNNLMVVPVQ